jgi:Cu(I)/Ag(I) efflux system membrane fusion protein
VIAFVIRHDFKKTFPNAVAQQAEALSNAKDLETAREAFKPLSESLIKYLDAHKHQAGQFIKVFCPVANASWLQTGTEVSNPYLGQQMAHCGQIQN